MICLAVALPLSALAQPSSQDQHPDGHREYVLKHRYSIGAGRHLNMVCTGKGSPTIVFMQGFNGGITDWRDVREPVSALTRSCFYDRAGFGFSDPSDKPMTSESIADDLHKLLRAAGIKDRVVLVAHSMGGLYATYYADKFFADLAGMVLVDPSFDGQFNYARSAEDEKALQLDADQFYSSMKSCAAFAQAGELSPGNPHNCFQIPSVTPNETEYLTHLFQQPSYYAAMRSQFENYTPVQGSTLAGDQEHNLKRSFESMPLVVLTAGLQPWTITEEGKKAYWAVWKDGHDKLAERSTRGESILLPNAHHFIQFDQPAAVIGAIRKVVMEARQ
jgi:pimeloyl-ACP methyl ester carboxylesterase